MTHSHPGGEVNHQADVSVGLIRIMDDDTTAMSLAEPFGRKPRRHQVVT
jgi:hypothetical protein